MSPAEIARLLRGRRNGKNRWMCKCPAHDDRSASCSVSDMGAGNTRVHCFAGCSQADVLKAVGLTWRDLKPGRTVDPEIKGRLADERKLEKLQRQYGLMLWLASAEPKKRLYWEAAIRRVLAEMEPLYWKLMPGKERFGKIRQFEIKHYRDRRMDWMNRKTT